MAIKIGDLSKAEKPPHFTKGQMIEIYEASGRSSDESTLRQKAKELYPDIVKADGASPITKRPPHGRWFDKGDGTYGPAAFVLVSGMSNAIGIMDDGTPHPF